ncbi:MAG: transaldolase family protein [Myxococcaceae bacterium]
MKPTFKSPLHQMVSTTATDFWNDSCSISELEYAIEHGAVGATTNPTIVVEVLKKELPLWRDRICQLAAQNPSGSEVEVSWKLIEEMAVKAAKLLHPTFVREQGKKGRLSIQTNPIYYRNPEALAEQALHFDRLAPNLQVKIPATAAGIRAMEEVTRHGVSINATVCFTVPQALAVAEAVERGMTRRAAEGGDCSKMAPVCTLMIGRLDDWMQVLAERDGIVADPGHLHWAGIACFKNAYALFKARGYRSRLLAAAYRHQLHWSELIGGDVVLTMPHVWQHRFNASSVEVKARIDDPVAPAIVSELLERFPDFGKAYRADGMTAEEFDSYGATRRTLRGFLKAYYELLSVVRDLMLPNPDAK